LIIVVLAIGWLWYSWSSLPTFTSANTIDATVKNDIAQAIDTRYAALTSGDAQRIRAYALKIAAPEDKAVIASSSDQDVLSAFDANDLLPPPSDLFTTDHADWIVTTSTAEIDYYLPGGGEAIFNSVNVSGTWY
jgi:hypothetical protein